MKRPTSRGKTAPTAIDLFSGCGGLTLGLKLAGFRVVGAVEIEQTAAETYHTNHPEVHLWERDVRKISINEILRTLDIRKGELGLLAGCPPCQGFSSMRTLNGGRRIDDRRNDLVFEFLRFVKGLRPKTIMMENVPALAENRRMQEMLNELKKLGYDAGDTPKVLNASNYGVPQRRRRMIMVCSRVGEIFLSPPSIDKVTVRSIIETLPMPGLSGDPLQDIIERRGSKIIKLIARIPKDGGSRIDAGKNYQLACHKRCDGFKDVYGRMKWDAPSPTITSGCTNPSKGRFLHPEQNRAITPREAAMLQGFPRDYFFSLAHGKQGVSLMVGNALPPEFIRRHAISIFERLSQ
jgi:DNA (cytosine-5)-methyltransferase 1